MESILQYPSITLEEKERFMITIVSASQTKYHHVVVEMESLQSAARFITTFAPKRGYKVVKVDIEEVTVLQ